MKLSGWGRYPIVESEPVTLTNSNWQAERIIALGNARSYGDAALANKHVPMKGFNRLIAFNELTGLLTCEAGVLLAEVMEVFLPKGWFLSVTPGTKLITVGGAVASDVHGKNHHIAGCFSSSVEFFKLLLPSGEVVECSRSSNVELFHATCGGMGLTGIILEAAFYLKPVQSQWIAQTTFKTANLFDTFQAFEEHRNQTYSVAWIDCLAKNDKLGRSLLMVGDFAEDGDLDYQPTKNISVPFNFPNFALNGLTVKLFNSLYYFKAPSGISQQKVGVDAFFYPLDAIQHWNRIYGKNGFVQFQFILPKSASFEGMTRILEKISASGMGSFLAVLKLYGSQNENWLSFPVEGYSLALDFKMQPGLVEFLHSLMEIVVNYDGRVYLAKDALVSKEHFDRGYPKAERFRELRKRLELDQHFQSLQSQRLGL